VVQFLGPITVLDAARAEELQIEEIAALHGYKLMSPGREPRCPDLCAALARVCAEPEGFRQLTSGGKKTPPGWLRSERPLTTLPTIDHYPRLRPVIEAMDALGGDPTLVAKQIGFDCLDSCHTWFSGHWLEDLAFNALNQIADELDIRSIALDLKLKPMQGFKDPKLKYFQLDVAAMVGYQLFAISCIASEEQGGNTKQHLLEAFVRARQLGGDEARTGLVCCVPNPDLLQREVEREWDAAGQIRVFGRRDLTRLADSFKQWIRTANKEEV